MKNIPFHAITLSIFLGLLGHGCCEARLCQDRGQTLSGETVSFWSRDSNAKSLTPFPTKPNASALPVIFDTDLATDCDDAGALAMLHGWVEAGRVELLAIGLNTLNPYSILCLDAINTWYGRGELPIGVTKSAAAYQPNLKNVRYAREISQEYPRTHPWNGPADAPDVVSVYRKALAAQPDIGSNSPGVVIISVGMLTNIRDLLQSAPCEHSPLTGSQLVKNKVRLWSCMGGRFSDSTAEYNIKQHLAAADYAIANWPQSIVFSPYEIGHEVTTGPGLRNLPSDHILRRIYQLHGVLKRGRPSWDQCACLYAVLGVDDGLAPPRWTLSGPGTVTVDVDGRTSWASSPNGLHQYKMKARDPGLIAEEIESLMVAATGGLANRSAGGRLLFDMNPRYGRIVGSATNTIGRGGNYIPQNDRHKSDLVTSLRGKIDHGGKSPRIEGEGKNARVVFEASGKSTHNDRSELAVGPMLPFGSVYEITYEFRYLGPVLEAGDFYLLQIWQDPDRIPIAGIRLKTFTHNEIELVGDEFGHVFSTTIEQDEYTLWRFQIKVGHDGFIKLFDSRGEKLAERRGDLGYFSPEDDRHWRPKFGIYKNRSIDGNDFRVEVKRFVLKQITEAE
jgi:inosine-uridine nucleoside N-ribohydrolase